MQIFVKIFGTTVTLDVEPTTTIEEIKEMLKEKKQIKSPMIHYELKFFTERLNDDKIIADYKIQKESTLNFIEKSPFRLRSTLTIKFKDEIIKMNFPCFCCYSILDYKKEIFKKRGYSVECQLLYSDEKGTNLLRDDDYESVPVLLIINDKDLKKGYNVKYFDGVDEYNIISGYDLEKIKEIKEAIEKNYKLPKGSFELIYNDIALSDDKTLEDYNIYYNSKIYLIVEKIYEKLLFKGYFLVYYKGNAQTARIEDSTILGIKKYLNEILFNGEVQINKMKIFFRGIILDDNINIEKEGLCSRKMELVVKE